MRVSEIRVKRIRVNQGLGYIDVFHLTFFITHEHEVMLTVIRTLDLKELNFRTKSKNEIKL